MILENHAAAKRFGRFALNGDFMWIASWIAHAVIYQAGRTQWPTGEFAKLNAVPRQINKFGRISKCGVLPNAFTNGIAWPCSLAICVLSIQTYLFRSISFIGSLS